MTTIGRKKFLNTRLRQIQDCEGLRIYLRKDNAVTTILYTKMFEGVLNNLWGSRLTLSQPVSNALSPCLSPCKMHCSEILSVFCIFFLSKI